MRGCLEAVSGSGMLLNAWRHARINTVTGKLVAVASSFNQSCRPRLLIRDPGSSSVDSGPRVWIEATGSSDRHDIVARTLFL
jgi:hypothetical protein